MESTSSLYKDIDIDLCNDMEEIARDKLIANQYDKDEVRALSDPLKTLIEHNMASIPVRKWKVVHSKEFRCPKDYKKALEKLTRKFEMGEDVNPFLSTRRDKTDMKDSLLYDWGIYHLHLTNRYNKNGRPKRSDYLLFVCYNKGKMYFIQIYRHHPNPFVKEELLKIIIHNWPELLSPSYMEEGHLLEPITDESRALLRKNGALSLVEIDGKIYFPPGGGYASNESSIRAVREADAIWNQMKLMEEWIFKNQSFICQEMMRFIPKAQFLKRLQFKLRKFSYKEITVVEITIFEVENKVLLEYNLLEQVCKFVFFDTDPIAVSIVHLTGKPSDSEQ